MNIKHTEHRQIHNTPQLTTSSYYKTHNTNCTQRCETVLSISSTLCFKNAPTLVSCSFNKHGLILIIFLVNASAHIQKWHAYSIFLVSSFYLLYYVAHYVWPYHETVRMSVCPSVCLFVCLSVCLSITCHISKTEPDRAIVTMDHYIEVGCN